MIPIYFLSLLLCRSTRWYVVLSCSVLFSRLDEINENENSEGWERTKVAAQLNSAQAVRQITCLLYHHQLGNNAPAILLELSAIDAVTEWNEKGGFGLNERTKWEEEAIGACTKKMKRVNFVAAFDLQFKCGGGVACVSRDYASLLVIINNSAIHLAT